MTWQIHQSRTDYQADTEGRADYPADTEGKTFYLADTEGRAESIQVGSEQEYAGTRQDKLSISQLENTLH